MLKHGHCNGMSGMLPASTRTSSRASSTVAALKTNGNNTETNEETHLRTESRPDIAMVDVQVIQKTSLTDQQTQE